MLSPFQIDDRVWSDGISISATLPCVKRYAILAQGLVKCDSLEVPVINGVDVSDMKSLTPSCLSAVVSAPLVASLDDDTVPSSDPDPVIRVNVAGHLFCSRRSTLNRLPYFRAIFEWKPGTRETEMIDRDPGLFSVVLRWVRSGLPYDKFSTGLSTNDALLLETELVFHGVGKSE